MPARRTWVAALVVVAAVAVPVMTRPADAAVVHPKPADLRPELIGDARQLVVVSSTGWSASWAKVTYYELRTTGWRRVAGPYSARVGRNGMKVDHVEGDGTTPAGSFSLVSAFGRYANSTKLPYTKLTAGDCWISDSTSPSYNTMVSQRPCGPLNEDLYAIARRGAYRKAIVSSYNMDPIVPGQGSAIFVHLHSRTAAGATRPTSGCVSLTDAQISVLLRRLDPAMKPRIVMGPISWLTD